MELKSISFDEQVTLHKLQHYLPSQASLKDFVHHNTLHAFQHLKFHTALSTASPLFGYKTYLSLDEFRNYFRSGKIREDVLDHILTERKGGANLTIWKDKLLHQNYTQPITSRIGSLRAQWKVQYQINLDKMVHPFLFRLLSGYLDQGISIWPFPVSGRGFLDSVKELEQNGLVSIFRTKRSKSFLHSGKNSIKDLFKILVGNEELFEQYLFDQQFAHPGWSGLVSVIELQPETLLDQRKVTLSDLVYLELLLEIDALDHKWGQNWQPLGEKIKVKPEPLFGPLDRDEVMEVLSYWQDAFEWTYFDDVLTGIKQADHPEPKGRKNFQALFCLDDREYSLRRYIENVDPKCETYGTPGFFGVEFFFKPEKGKFFTKACPAPVTPKYLIKEEGRRNGNRKDVHYTKRSHMPVQGWLLSQTLGFWAAFRLFLNIFKPSLSPATAYSFRHMDKHSRLSVETQGLTEDGLQIGFTLEEMAARVSATLGSIGLTRDFSPIVYMIGHGASSVNNTHYAGYDCGACCGRPGAVNARVFSYMANHPKVRKILRQEGLDIPDVTVFLGGMHDTTRDEIEFYDDHFLPEEHLPLHLQNKEVFEKALSLNAKERSRRFDTLSTKLPLKKLHKEIKKRSVSLFEPRPELNHATNALCIVGRASLTKRLFLDRRPFMNSYNYQNDPEGKYLLAILNAATPVCGGINLEYYFSRVDNEKLGAGTKLPHNVVGLIGVANGVEGDLRPGLPSQMIELHDPVRLLFVVEHFPEVVLKTIKENERTYEWFINEWVFLAVKNPVSGEISKFKNGDFFRYHSIRQPLEETSDITPYIENSRENLPVYLTQA